MSDTKHPILTSVKIMFLLSFMVFLYTDLPLSSPRLQAIENHFSALNTLHNSE